MTFSNYKKRVMSEDMLLVCNTKSRRSSATRTGVCVWSEISNHGEENKPFASCD